MSKKLTTEEFIAKAISIHGNKYDYSKVVYTTIRTKVCIACHIHGDYYQEPKNHLKGQHCPTCANDNRHQHKKHSHQAVIESFIHVHGNKYSYDNVVYNGNAQKVCIICKEHGEFWQDPAQHKKGHGCPRCMGMKKSADQLIQEFIHIHGSRYSYENMVYLLSSSKICIICKEHGEFWQTPNSHKKGHGCPKCKQSKLENAVIRILEGMGEKYETQKTFIDCIATKPLPFDIYINRLNLCIECDGEQHYKPIEIFGGIDAFNILKQHDKIKTEYCNKENTPFLLRISYKDKTHIKEILTQLFTTYKCPSTAFVQL